MSRVIWKGAISFGLVHVPVALLPASQESGIDFDWLDKRSMDPVGYLRINKRTGQKIEGENIVKGIQQDDGHYVVLSDEEIQAAYPKTTQTIEIESFVKAGDISFCLLEKPYFLEPADKGEKVYALLREAMAEAGVIGVARVVLHTREHLAVLVPSGAALMLNTIRWPGDMRPSDDLKLPPTSRGAAGLKPAELKMATQLISDMTAPWHGEDHRDRFVDAIHALVQKKLAAGETETVGALEPPPEAASTNVVDLTELLARSLKSRHADTATHSTPANPPATSPATTRRRSPPRKTGTPRATPRKRA